MNRAALLWGKVGATTALSLALLVLVAPPRPAPQLPLVVAALVGLSGGVTLYVAATRSRPRLPADRHSTSLAVGTQAFLALLATNEEIVWRRVVLGELLGAGVIAAVGVSSIGFALAHRSRRLLQLGSGATFGALYVSTGALAASVLAHWSYNALVAALVERRRAPAGAAP